MSSLKDVQVTSGWQVKQELYLLATVSVKHTITVHHMHNFCHLPYALLCSRQRDKHIFNNSHSKYKPNSTSPQQKGGGGLTTDHVLKY